MILSLWLFIHYIHSDNLKKTDNIIITKQKKNMGQALNGCQNCTTTTPTNSNSSLNEISTYYSNRLT